MTYMSGGQIVVEVLEKEHVEQAFCVPGESYLGVIDSIYEHEMIDLITTRHESSAAFMAEAYAKETGKVGVCMATRGPGATNLSIGLHTAMQDSTPVIALIGQVERPFLGKEAFQEIDLAAYFRHLCKATVEIDIVERIPELLHHAFYTAKSGRPGPVVVSLPHDMLEDGMDYKGSKGIAHHPPVAESSIVQQVVHEVKQAKQPLVLAGGGVIRSEAQAELQQFVEQLQLPVVSAFRRFNVLENDHSHYVGWLGFGASSSLVQAIQEADVVLVFGTRLSQVTSQDYSLLNEEQQTIIQVDIDADTIGKSFIVDTSVVSDITQFLQTANSQLIADECNNKAERVNLLRQQYETHSTLPKFREEADVVELTSVMSDLIDLVPEHSVLTSDAGNFYGWLARYFRFTKERQYIGPTSGAMGYGLPAAIGVKVGSPHKTVISLSGDGGFMMTIQELETAIREKIQLIAIVVNNNMYGTIRAHQEKQFPNRVQGTSLTNPNFVEVAKLFGCDGQVVKSNKDFRKAFEAALQSDLLYVIEVQPDPELLSVADVKT